MNLQCDPIFTISTGDKHKKGIFEVMLNETASYMLWYRLRQLPHRTQTPKNGTDTNIHVNCMYPSVV